MCWHACAHVHTRERACMNIHTYTNTIVIICFNTICACVAWKVVGKEAWFLCSKVHIGHRLLKIYLVALITLFMVLQLDVSPYFTCCDCAFHVYSLTILINSIILSTDERTLPSLIISYIPATVKSILPVITTKQGDSHFWLVFGRYSVLMSATH